MVVRFSGGLGNQMFQYAFLLSLQYRFPQKTIEGDLGDYEVLEHHNGYELEKIFGIKIPLCSDFEKERHKINMSLPNRVLRKIGLKNVGYPKRIMDPERGFDEEFINSLSDQDFLWGYWQDEKYFKDIKNDILKEFTFPVIKKEDEKNYEIKKIIESENSVSLHVRRGDYLLETEYISLCESDYYQKAIQEMKEKVKEPYWFVFSDDINWCRKNLTLGTNACYVEHNTGQNSFRDMQLMSLCKHNIIANSTFSWWGAWLNINSEKVVICPEQFYKDNEGFNKNIVCDGWKTITIG